MPVPRIDDIRPLRHRHGAGSKLWAEWCFVRICFRHVRVRLLVMLLILAVGAPLFKWLDDTDHSWPEAAFATFSLVFGEPPSGEFPSSIVLEALYFIVPILGLAVIIEGIVDFSLVLRDRRRFERTWCIMLAESFENHIVLAGLGRLGYRTFKTLRKLGEAVVVIATDDPDSVFLEEVRRDGSPLIVGDARQEALLVDANIGKAKSIVVATGDDLANLEIALDARKINPGIRVVLRMFDQNIADKVSDGFNIHLAMSQSALSAPTFATCAVSPGTVHSMIVGDQVVATQRWLVRSEGPLIGRTVAQLMRDYGICIIEHRRPPETHVCPDPDTTLAAGDGVLVQAPIEHLTKLRAKAVQQLAIED